MEFHIQISWLKISPFLKHDPTFHFLQMEYLLFLNTTSFRTALVPCLDVPITHLLLKVLHMMLQQRYYWFHYFTFFDFSFNCFRNVFIWSFNSLINSSFSSLNFWSICERISCYSWHNSLTNATSSTARHSQHLSKWN